MIQINSILAADEFEIEVNENEQMINILKLEQISALEEEDYLQIAYLHRKITELEKK